MYLCNCRNKQRPEGVLLLACYKCQLDRNEKIVNFIGVKPDVCQLNFIPASSGTESATTINRTENKTMLAQFFCIIITLLAQGFPKQSTLQIQRSIETTCILIKTFFLLLELILLVLNRLLR